MAVSYFGEILYRNGVPEHVGRYTSGTMLVTSGSTANIGGSAENRLFALGNSTGGVGTVLVEGPDSTLNFEVFGEVATSIEVGGNGTGSMTIRDGGTLNFISDGRESLVQIVVEEETGSSLAVIDGTILMYGLEAAVFASGSESQTGISLLEGSQMTMRGSWQARLIVDAPNGLYLGAGSALNIDSGVDQSETASPDRNASRVSIGKSFDSAEAVVENSRLTVSSLVASAQVEIGLLTGTGATAAYGGKLSITDGGLLEILAAQDVSNSTATLGVGGGKGSVGELILTDSELEMSAYDVELYVGVLSGTGLLSADHSAITLAATDSVTIYLGLSALPGGEGVANVLLDNEQHLT